MKKFIKGAVLLLCAVSIAVLSGFLSYTITSNILKRRSEAKAENKSVETVSQKVVFAKESNLTETEEEKSFKYYLVKLEGRSINIYASYDEYEELLFGEIIDVNSLSRDDETILHRGIRLGKMSEVTEFIENFTS